MARTVDGRGPHQHPHQIGRYRIIERIGRGAMGVVYRASDDAMGREVALKLLTAGMEDDLQSRARFQREAEAAAHLSHPNVITIYDVGEDGDRFYIVMELLRGDTLKSFLRPPHAAPLELKIDLMIQLCAGLGAAHKASIFHRDIKPGNIFVRTDGLLKILDFGVARLGSSGMANPGFIVGTPDYMSPEQARGEDIDGRSDIFSAGGVFYFMLTGRKPFPAGDLPTLFHQIQREAPRPIESGPPADLIAVVMKALSRSRDSRYQTCEALMADLQVVRRRHREETAGAGGARAAGVGRDRSSDPAVAIDPAPPEGPFATDDTADVLPAASRETDETVTSTLPPTWTKRVADRIDSAVSGALARLGRMASPAPARETGMRKR